jgi:hypothetical protein
VSQIPWWALPLTAALFALAGAGVAQGVAARLDWTRHRVRRTRRWYEERKSAYVTLMAVYERVTYRLRAGYAAGVRDFDPLTYLDEVGPALAQVRLLASDEVRSAAVAVHLLLEQLHGPRPAVPLGVEPEKNFLEVLGHVPLVMHDFEAAVREELEIRTRPDAVASPPRLRGIRRRPAAPVGDEQ